MLWPFRDVFETIYLLNIPIWHCFYKEKKYKVDVRDFFVFVLLRLVCCVESHNGD